MMKKERAQKILQEVFGYQGFKPQQEEIIDRILNKEGHTLGIMPTGGGKSLCFQIPAFIQENITIVISPLIALMKDQIDNLVKRGIDSAYLMNSSISEESKEEILGLILKRKIKLLYLSPESLKSERILDVLKQVVVDLLVIDEAHCISTWGHNFRPDYLRLPIIMKELGNPKVLALTATATREVEKDIQEQLGIYCKVFKASFDRPNLYLEVVLLDEDVKKELFLINLLSRLQGPTIIFVTYQKTAEKLAELIRAKGKRCLYYHAGLERDARERVQNAFISGEEEVIVATIAFGMGIDKPNIRNIIHYNISQSIENYYQEIGRAGRDGNIAHCITLFTQNDEKKIKNLIAGGWPDEQKIKDILFYLNSKNKNYMFITNKKLYYDCDVREIPANLILQRLEETQAIKIFSHVLYRIKLKINKPLQEIILENKEKMKSKENPVKGDYADDLQKILGSEFFGNSKRSWIVLEEVMEETSLNYFRVLEILKYMKTEGAVDFLDVERKDLLWLKKNVQEMEIQPLANLFKTLLEHDLKKVDLLIEVLTNQKCIRKGLGDYFAAGERIENCEMCGYCAKKEWSKEIQIEKDENYASEELIRGGQEIEFNLSYDIPLITILKCLVKDGRIPHRDMAKIFTGTLRKSSSKWKREMQSYNLMPQFKGKEEILEKIMSWCQDNQLIQEEMDGYLRITKKGLEYLVSALTISVVK